MRTHTAIRWLWSATTGPARLARATLAPAAATYAACVRLRARAYHHGLLPRSRVEVPTIGVGNLSVGGTGKTPIASWIAGFCERLGVRPGVALRGYGGDEGQVHRERVPGAVVVEGRDRLLAARTAVGLGARVIVLDDAFQRLDLRRDLNLLLVSAEAAASTRWTLPAGPWREPWSAIERADMVVITRKRASVEAARRLSGRLGAAGIPQGRIAVARLDLASFTTLKTHAPVDPSSLRGARLLAVSGVADPASYAYQLRRFGAQVYPAAEGDHHAYTPADIRRLLSAATFVDYVVMTHKDAVKLRPHWPDSGPPALVAHLEPSWEVGGELLTCRVTDLLTRHYTLGIY